MATNTFMCVFAVASLLSLCLGVPAQQSRSCSPGMFCPIGANCTSNTSLCTIVCPNETDHMQQGNHLTGNCERIPDGTDHWMDSTLYEVFILTNQPVNTPILSISFLSTDQFQTNGFTYTDLVTDITFTLNGSCPYFYFTNMLKKEISFENYYDLYVPDDIESVSLALAETVPPDDYEMEVTVTNGDTVLQRRDIIVHVRDVPPCTTGPETFIDFSSANFTVSKSTGSFVVTLVSSGNIPSQSFIIGIIAEADNSSEFPATAGADFTPGRYNATFTTGATTATTSIPIIAGGSDGDVKQFSLRLFIDGAAYQQCVFSGNVSTATVFVTPVVEIVQPPAGISRHRVTFDDSTSFVQLMCSLNISISSNVVVTWMHNESIAMTTHPNEVITNGNTTTLVLRNLQPSDAGDYQCVFNDTVSGRTLSRNFILQESSGPSTSIFNSASISILTPTSTFSTATTFTTATTTVLSTVTTSTNTATATVTATDGASSSGDVNVVVIVAVALIIIIIVVALVVVALVIAFCCRRRKKEVHNIYETVLQSSSTGNPKPVYSEINNGQDSKEPEYMEICNNTYSAKQTEKVTMHNNPAYSISFDHQDKMKMSKSFHSTKQTDKVTMQENPAYSIPSECQVDNPAYSVSFATKQ